MHFSSGAENNFYRKSDIRKDWDIGVSLILILVLEMVTDIAYISGKNDWCKQSNNGNKRDRKVLLFCFSCISPQILCLVIQPSHDDSPFKGLSTL